MGYFAKLRLRQLKEQEAYFSGKIEGMNKLKTAGEPTFSNTYGELARVRHKITVLEQECGDTPDTEIAP